jgi:protein-S-isoprenylcysteine O-methyltransferase Ste14
MDADAAQILGNAHLWIWIAWLVYWTISSYGNKAKAREETRLQRLAHFAPLIAAVLLFIFSRDLPGLRERIFPPGLLPVAIGTVVLVAGLLFSVWARVTLGRNWSGTVAVKRGHELIQSGPYRWVRHPIYTGILGGFLGSALAIDRWGSIAAVALVFAGFWFKLLREEAWMRQTFGESYTAYCARTKRLLPFLL